MAGNTGSPLCAELNRIANYGVYPDRDDFLEEQGAANVWAGTSGLGLLGALNYIVDPTRTDNNYKGLTAVCNELAGTRGLSEVDALRTINHPADVLLKGTTPQSSVYYVDAATPRYNYPGYVYLPGIVGQYISVPDSNSLDITGDIDLRWYGALDSSTSSAYQILVTKGFSAYEFRVTNSSQLQLVINSGTFTLTVTPTALPTTPTWLRVTYVASTGAATFYSSINGTTWTQIGTTQQGGYALAIGTNTHAVDIGERDSQFPLAGKVYRVQIYSDITSTTKVLDVDLTTNVTSATYDQFTATTGQLCTIFGQNTLTNGGTAGSLLPTTVGSSLAADSNDAKFLDHTGTNYVYLPGVNTSFMSVPDSSALDITDNIDLRAYIAMDDWTPAVNSPVITKWLSAGDQRGIIFEVTTTGGLNLQLSANGLAQSAANSTATMGIPDGTTKWIRATYRRSDQRVQFFTSDNGTTWTQLGADVTSAQNGIFANTADVGIGTFSSGATAQVFAGKIFRAQIFSDITGTTKVLDVDTSVITTGAATSFTAVTGQTVTINRSTSGRKSVAVTQPTWLFGTDDYMEVNNRYMAHSTSAENYVYLPGTAGNNMTVPDNPPLDITGDIDIQVRVALDDWTPGAYQAFVSKFAQTGDKSFVFQISNTNVLNLTWSANNSTLLSANSTVAPTITDGATLWVRATLDVDNGASGNTVTFFTSTDGITWTQLGSPVVTAGVTSIYSGNTSVQIGTHSSTSSIAKGKFFRTIIKNGIDGTVVLDADASVITLPSQTTFVDRSSNAYTVTINKSGVGTFVSTGNYLYLPGIASNYASAPDSAALSVTGDLDLRVKVALDDWTPAADMSLIAKYAGSQHSYILSVMPAGTLRFYWSANGTADISATSSVATGLTDGSTKWIRATMDVDNGASGNTVTFYTSDDGSSWTQLGSTVVTAGVTSIFDGTAIQEIGTYQTGTGFVSRGKFFRAQVLNGIGGTVAFDANFENSITSLNQASFTESSTNGATVTINRSGSTYRSAGVIDAGYLYPGATNTFSNSTTNFLDFGATDSFTVVSVLRYWNAMSANRAIISKYNGNTNDPGYANRKTPSALSSTMTISDAVNSATATASALPAGTLEVNSGIINRATQTAQIYSNNVASATASTSSVGSLSNPTRPLRIANYADGALQTDMELVAAAIFRTVLTPKNITDINNYFQGRD